MIDLVTDSFAGPFCRVEPRGVAVGFLTDLFADLQIKTCWQVAEQVGHTRPEGMQRLRYRAWLRVRVSRSARPTPR
jgi:hypothetical protein